jgi:hypothetical protein
MPTSPLNEPDPKSMDEQMRRLDTIVSGDPRSLTRAQRDAFVAYLRDLRAQWEKDSAAGAKRAKAPKFIGPINVDEIAKDLGL